MMKFHALTMLIAISHNQGNILRNMRLRLSATGVLDMHTNVLKHIVSESERQDSNLQEKVFTYTHYRFALHYLFATVLWLSFPIWLRSVVAVHPKITIITPHRLVVVSAPYLVTASVMLAVKSSLPVSISFPSSKNICGLTGCAHFYQSVFRDNALTQFVRYIPMHQTCTAYRNDRNRTCINDSYSAVSVSGGE